MRTIAEDLLRSAAGQSSADYHMAQIVDDSVSEQVPMQDKDGNEYL